MAVLGAEHLALRGIARVLQIDAAILRRGGDFDVELWRNIVAYIREFPDRIHHPKEEDFLFKAMRQRSAATAGLLDRLNHEHELEKEKIDALSVALDAFEGDEAGATDHLAELAMDYADFLAAHLKLEEEEAFPLAERVLTEEDWVGIDAVFAKNQDPLGGAGGEAEAERFRDLHRRIMQLGTLPIGVPKT